MKLVLARRDAREYFWRNFLWALLVPRRNCRVRPTAAGRGLLVFILLSGAGAYVLASNVLFLTSAVLVTVLFFDGAMSRMNLRGITARLHTESSMRAGVAHFARIEISNTNRRRPVTSLHASMRSRSAGAESLFVAERIESGDTVFLDWRVKPMHRGVERLVLMSAGSLFPFGFFERSTLAEACFCDVSVWPARVAYRLRDGWRFGRVGDERASMHAGQGGDLLALRDYRSGDAQSRVHWKASARMRRLLVREFSDQQNDDVVLWVRTDAALWRSDPQFEKMCSLAATLAEDLFEAGALSEVAIDGRWRRAMHLRADVDAFLDALAACEKSSAVAVVFAKNTLSFSPDGAEGVDAYVDGKAAASA